MTELNHKDSFRDYLRELPNYLTVFITPAYFMTIGPMLIEMGKEIGTASGNINLIITFFTIGLALGQLTSVYYNAKFTKISIVTASYIAQIALLVLLSFIKKLYVFYALYLLLGYIAGVIWLQAMEYILESRVKNKDRLTTIFLSCYPVGNFVAPFIASSLIDNNINWRYSYYITAALAFIILIFYIVIYNSGRRKFVEQEKEKINFREIFIDKRINIIFILGCIILMFYCISETIIATWSPTFLRTVRFFEIDMASLSVSIFWMAILTGRIIVSFLVGKIKSNYIMIVLAAIGVISMLLLTFAKTIVSVFIAIGFSGLGCSGIITLGISSTSTLYEKGRGVLASLVFVAVNIATSAAPFITKSVSSFNILLSLRLAALFMLLTGVVIISKTIYENNSNRT